MGESWVMRQQRERDRKGTGEMEMNKGGATVRLTAREEEKDQRLEGENQEEKDGECDPIKWYRESMARIVKEKEAQPGLPQENH